ncbi:hypothetical protein FHR32_003546 [Streptosporangium album]|uniref:Uncharacterized protein n=1 Tax=Streptosporangium album TaxID=47479 RepID=A0A7W7W9T3_9ACTN|nr:hypothetical protein [Streptosporangium album]MBB4939241.1 hypothetical protein [Streptosporangium album]
MLKDSPHLVPRRLTAGIAPQLGDAELVTPAMTQAMLGFTSDTVRSPFLRPTSSTTTAVWVRLCGSIPITILDVVSFMQGNDIRAGRRTYPS